MVDDEDDDGSYGKEAVSPNEACYIDVDPIDLNALIPLNDSMAELRAEQYKGRTKTIGGKIYHIWDPRTHERPQFYNIPQL